MKTISQLFLLVFLVVGFSVNASEDTNDEACHLEYTTYQATVTGYCQEARANLAAEIPLIEKLITIKPIESIPEVFWYSRQLKYSLVKQENLASPVVFVIAGTGASHRSAKMQTLQKTLYGQGYHVISISSPTFANYIINATTENDITGDLEKDAQTLHKVMQQILAAVKQEDGIQPTSFSLTGYSLGGAHSAFIAQLDETEKVFNFEKIVLINPPVSLYNSVQILDGYLDLENNRAAVVKMFNDVFERFAEAYASQESSKIGGDSIYKLFEGADLTEDQLKLLIGTSFRLSSTDMLFAIDVSRNIGAFTYKNHTISKFESTTHSMRRANEITFTDYFDRAVVPWEQEREPSVTKEQLIERLSLHSIEDYIKSNAKMAMVTNADDIILKEGEVEYLQEIFGERAKIFERGGHCGNMDRVSFVEYMKGQFVGGSL